MSAMNPGLDKKQEEKIEHRIKSRRRSETLMQYVFLVCAFVSVAAVVIICYFIFANGLPAIFKIGPLKFITGLRWKPTNEIFGIFPMIVGSLYVTAGSMVIGVPIGLMCSVYLAYFCPPKLYKTFKPMVELLAGIPSIVYGFCGLMMLVPLMQHLFPNNEEAIRTGGKNILTASILLGIMILPTVIGLSEAAIRAVPSAYYEGALALGATKERSIFFAVLPAAKSGIMAGIILGMGRSIGETMAVNMVAGNQPILPKSILSGVRTLTANIVIEMGYAADLHRGALIGTAVVLFVFILIINVCFSLVRKKS